MPRAALHLSPLGDLLGVFLMVLLPGFPPASIQGLQVRAAGCGAVCEDCRPVALKLGFSPTVMALRLEEAPLVRFGLTFDRRHRPDLWPLREELARVRQAFPELTTIELHVDDAVEVDLLVAVADLCIGAGFPNVVVGAAVSGDP